MLPLFLTVYVLYLTAATSPTSPTSPLLPRMTFTEKETAMKRLPLPGHHAPVQIVLQGDPDIVIAAGQKHLNSFNFQNPQKTWVEIDVLWTECIDNRHSQRLRDCNYKITVVHKREEDNQVFLCGTNGKETLCCDMNLSEQIPMCRPSEKMKMIKDSIREFVIKEGEPFALVDSLESDLYITYSGSQGYVGIHKFGKNRVAPARHNKEQHYVGLVLSRQRDPENSKVYAFYREKVRDRGLYSEMWLPFVTRVCTVDLGGPKNLLQFCWTSQMNARLFCGDADGGKHFPELIDVATVHADKWQDTRVYALFRNEWGMSAVCVYTIQDIEHVFTTSTFKGADGQSSRPRECVADSTKIQQDILRMIETNSEMEQWVRPVNSSGPLLSNHHTYTHIHVHGSQDNSDSHHTVLFLSLNNGGIHKVMQNKSQTFVIAEYQPFNHSTHIVSISLHTSSRKLYVSSRNELVQLNVANCAQYGDSCELCVLARDPYCGWNGIHCTPEIDGTLQDLTQGNPAICMSSSKLQLSRKVSTPHLGATATHADEAKGSVTLPPKSKYFLQCPVSSHHAQYTWRHLESDTSCSSREQRCLLLIDSMGPEQAGTYKCVSEEMGYIRVLAQYQLQLSKAAGRSSSPLVWLCLMAVLIKSLS
ncbi:semaphorin-7A [Anarrhichthys ocellatus]|uniref:semaphorin-7A n=1 Tax=Anarrhichthys ocellatus TaxID=433405 RepID=UPI0012ED3516|nr:semaphorin-7A-like [Anarrhichthys ocellatus]